ncbi:hypothetical protein ACIA5D_47830 [Actinoplanes sp. NPDC051513]|uniref:hypothetical protein n=1 Tax=Actinoplanes sp. NPDC051513 TaxID=3363908 RepID=UPI0037B1CD81
MQTADKQAAKDSENKPFLERVSGKAMVGIAAGFIATAVIAVGRTILQSGESDR